MAGAEKTEEDFVTNNEHIGPLVLTSVNYKRLKAVRINFGEPGLTVIEGKNSQGKSSVLDSLLAVLLGEGAVAEKPIHEGEDAAKVELTLTNGRKIVRTFRRSDKNKKGYTTELLLLTDEDGKLSKPAETIREWLGSDVAFDPLQFSRMKDKDRRALLAQMLGIDVDAFDRRYRELYDQRRAHYALYETAKRKYDSKPQVPAASPRVDVAALNDELTAAMEKKDAIASQGQRAAAAKQKADDAAVAVRHREDEIIDIENKLLMMKEDLVARKANLAEKEAEAAQLKADYGKAALETPDIAAIQQKLSAADETNRAADQIEMLKRQNAQIDEDYKREDAVREKYDADLKVIQKEKTDALAAAKYPVEGMSFGDDDVLLNGLPFSQASQSEQIKAGIAVALAFNPKLRIIVTHDASALDADNLALLHKMAQDNKCYVVAERVSNEPGSGIYIEDGEVAG